MLKGDPALPIFQGCSVHSAVRDTQHIFPLRHERPALSLRRHPQLRRLARGLVTSGSLGGAIRNPVPGSCPELGIKLSEAGFWEQFWLTGFQVAVKASRLGTHQ